MKFISILLLLLSSSFIGFSQNYSVSSQSKYRLSLGYGIGYRIGNAAPNANKEYIDGIRFGQGVNADASYFLNPSYALGLKYTYFLSGGSAPYILSNINLHYIGPILYNNISLNSAKSKLMYGMSLGYIVYRDDGWMNNGKTLVKGNSVGALVELAYDFKVYKRLYVGANAGLVGGVLSKVKINDVPKKLEGDKESLIRATFDIGFRYIR